MAPIAEGVIVAVKTGKALIAAGKAIQKSPVEEKFDLAIAKAARENGQVAYAVAKGLVAHAMGKTPTDEDVDAFMAAAIDDPAFPARAFRLMSEAKKTASIERQKLLAAVLWGGSVQRADDDLDDDDSGRDDRERVDSLVERLTMSDVRLLSQIATRARQGVPPPTSEVRYQLKILALEHLKGVELVAPAEIQAGLLDQDEGVRDTLWPDPKALLNLTITGCIERPNRATKHLTKTKSGQVSSTDVYVTDLGELLLSTLEEVQAGLDAEVPT